MEKVAEGRMRWRGVGGEDMNYIRHLNAFFSFVRSDNRLTSSHVSLYMALFHYWNFNRFHNPFSIYRENIMQLSKLSKNTYHKCIKELHEAKYIYYHPSASKFQAVRISVIRLDKEEPSPTRFKQLDLFDATEQLSSAGGGGTRYASDGGGEAGPGHNIETGSVAKLSQHSPNIKTDTVANLGHSYKPNINKQRETLPHQIFKRNDKIQKAINHMAAGVPNPGHHGVYPELVSGSIPNLTDVETHFQQQKYPKEEATKFFNHYKSLHWKLQGKTPILDWKPLVEKWMSNAKKWNTVQENSSLSPPLGDYRGPDLQYIYDSFLEGKNIFKHISPEHFDHLKLSMDEETIEQARQERINQISGTNQHSLIEIWKAYLTNDPASPLLQKDKPILIDLARSIAVIKYFHQLKQSGVVTLSLPKGQPP